MRAHSGLGSRTRLGSGLNRGAEADSGLNWLESSLYSGQGLEPSLDSGQGLEPLLDTVQRLEPSLVYGQGLGLTKDYGQGLEPTLDCAQGLYQSDERLISSFLASPFVLELGWCSTRRRILGWSLEQVRTHNKSLRSEWTPGLFGDLSMLLNKLGEMGGLGWIMERTLG